MKMEPAWRETAESNFRLGSYKVANGQLHPCNPSEEGSCAYAMRR